jgi:hypothetical protein
MSAGKIIGYAIAGILLIFGVIFILGAFSPDGNTGWILVGLILVGIAFGIIWFVARQKPAAAAGESVTLNIDLPANVNLDSLKCKSCGGVLSADNIKMVAGAPVVTCPYCGTVYQLTEEPKW